MTDDRPFAASGLRGVRVGVVSVLVALAFLLGLALAVVLVRHQTRQATADVTPQVASPAPTPLLPTPAGDPAALTAREAVLAGQVSALESRIAALSASAETAGGQATRAEALLTVAAARRMLDRGLGLGALELQLQARFGEVQPRAVAIVRAAARQPVTLEDLRQGLDAIGPVVTSGVGDGWWRSARHELGTLVVLRRAGTPSPLPADHLMSARRLMAADQVEAARAEVAQLPGAADAANWTAAARRYVLARQALDMLDNAALTGPMPPPVMPLLP